METGTRIWTGGDGHRYIVQHVRGVLHFSRQDGRWFGSVPVVGRDVVSLDAAQLEALLQGARAKR